jgi:hypothetical protein
MERKYVDKCLIGSAADSEQTQQSLAKVLVGPGWEQKRGQTRRESEIPKGGKIETT